MSRIGKKPIPVPQGVKVALRGRHRARGGAQGQADPRRCPSGHLGERRTRPCSRSTASSDHRTVRALHGLTRSLLANMVHGREGRLRAQARDRGHRLPGQLQGKNLQLALGYSHPVIFPLPDGIQAEVERQVVDHPAGRRQGPARADRGQAAGAAQARPLQGQGHQVRGRVHPPQGRQEGGGQVMLIEPEGPRGGRSGTCASARGCGAPRSVRGWPCSGA